MNIKTILRDIDADEARRGGGCSMTRPCECGLDVRPRRLFGFPLEPVDGAPCFFSGSIAPGGCGLPSTDSLAGFVSAGNGKIQGGSKIRRSGGHGVDFHAKSTSRRTSMACRSLFI